MGAGWQRQTLITSSSESRRRARLFFSSVKHQNSTCLFDLIYLVADVWGESFNQSQVALQWFLLPAVLLERGTETQILGSFLFSSKQPHCGPICSFMCSRPLQRWLSVSVAHSLWNLSCAGDSFHSPAQPKYHVPKMGNATCMQNFKKEKKKNKKKKLQQWRVSSVLVSIFHTNMATGYHNKSNRLLMMVFFLPSRRREMFYRDVKKWWKDVRRHNNCGTTKISPHHKTKRFGNI